MPIYMDSVQSPAVNREIEVNPVQVFESLPAKQRAVAILMDEGLKNGEIAEAFGITPARVTQIDQKLKKYMITGNTKLLKTASKTISSLAAGKKVGDIEHVKDSTAANVSMYVMDHWDAVQKVSDQPVSSNYTQVNINITNNVPESHSIGHSSSISSGFVPDNGTGDNDGL